MRTGLTFWLLLAVFIVVTPAPLALAATNGIIELHDWHQINDPFSDSNTTAVIPIGSMALISSSIGARISMQMACSEENVVFAFGTNGNLDVQQRFYYPAGRVDEIQVLTRLDDEQPWSSTIPVRTANRFEYHTYAANRLQAGNRIILRIPIDGADIILGVPLTEPAIREFLGGCTSFEAAAELRRQQDQKEAELEAQREQEKERREAPLRQQCDLVKSCIANCTARNPHGLDFHFCVQGCGFCQAQ